ncbi:rod shape-determining protein MreC [soil metagenome]
MKKRSKKSVLIGALSLVDGIFLYRSCMNSGGIIERYGSSVAYPLLLVQNKIVAPFKSYFQNRKSVSELEQQLLALQEQHNTVLAQNIELQGMISYAQDTQELVEFKKQYDFSQAVLGQVLVKNFSEQAHFFLIDKGSNAGVAKDMVAVYKDCLVGRVTEVYPRYSKLTLLSDQNCKVAVYCAQSKATGIYQGDNQEWNSHLNHVSHLAQLEPGELILSSGDGLIFPRGFGIGKIKSFQNEGLFHQVVVEPLVDLHAINHCYLIQKTG